MVKAHKKTPDPKRPPRKRKPATRAEAAAKLAEPIVAAIKRPWHHRVIDTIKKHLGAE